MTLAYHRIASRPSIHETSSEGKTSVDTFLKIAQVVALLSASALCAYLIVVLMRLNGLLEMLQKDFSEMNKNLKPVLENLNVVTDKLKSITTKVDDQVLIFNGSLHALRQMADNVVQFEERVQQRIEEPIIRISSLLGAIINRVASLFGRATQQAG